MAHLAGVAYKEMIWSHIFTTGGVMMEEGEGPDPGPGSLRKMCSLKAFLISFLLVAVTGVCIAFIVLYFTAKPASSSQVEGKF